MKKFVDMRILRSVKPTRCEFDPGGKRQTLCVEFNAGLLDFRVGQKPDKGFIVKINNLDAITPWIAKVAAERRLIHQLSRNDRSARQFSIFFSVGTLRNASARFRRV